MIAPLCLSLALLASPGAAACEPRPSGAACAPTADPELERLLSPLLGAIDRPVSDEAWRRLPARALAALEAIAVDPSALPTRRARALEGAAALGADGALHRGLAEDPSVPHAVRHSALRGLGAILAPAALEATLVPLISADADRRIRALAGEVLAQRATPGACALVRDQALREGPVGRGAFRRALAACGER